MIKSDVADMKNLRVVAFFFRNFRNPEIPQAGEIFMRKSEAHCSEQQRRSVSQTNIQLSKSRATPERRDLWTWRRAARLQAAEKMYFEMRPRPFGEMM